MSGQKKLLVATTNLKKLEELRTLLAELPLELLSLSDFENIREVPENGKTFEENAAAKALGYAEQTGLMTLGEDSGLCCDALEGAPGVYSARFAGLDKDDLKNNEKLLRLLKDVPDNCRGAHYASAVAIAEPGRVLESFYGEVHGFIAKEPVGNNGFGYDPIFYYPDFKATFGQTPSESKHKVSHRAKALHKMKDFLSEYLGKRVKSAG